MSPSWPFLIKWTASSLARRLTTLPFPCTIEETGRLRSRPSSCTQKAPNKEVIGIMPTYEYLCQTCSHRFETWQKMTDDPLTSCPECGAHIRRVLFPAVVVFKGRSEEHTSELQSQS